MRISLCDISPGMVAEASATIAAHGRHVQAAAACDARNLPFADGSFDLVTANHMLYHVPTPSAALRELRRVLRPSGRALIATNSPGHMHQLNTAIATATGPFEPRLNHLFGIDPGEAMLREVFGAIEWHTFVNTLLVTDIEDVFAYATSFPPAHDADASQLASLRTILAAEIERGNGSLRIDTRTGAFVVSGRAP